MCVLYAVLILLHCGVFAYLTYKLVVEPKYVAQM